MRQIRIITLLFTFCISVTAASESFAGEATVQTVTIGKMENGVPIQAFTLINAAGIRARIIEYGATITELQVPDARNTMSNVILGSESLDAYVKGFPAASVIGRYANRIKNASFPLNGNTITVSRNAGPHHIHGGRANFAKVAWKGKANVVDGEPQAELTYESPDGEEGFPGNMRISVVYQLKDKGTLRIVYKAECDKPTVVNLTNHAYFNLAASGDVLKHELEIMADQFTEADASLIPTGAMSSVAGTPLDFRTPHKIGERIEQLKMTRGYDHNYIINGTAGTLRIAAKVIEPQSGRTLECWTTEPGVQLYTANGFNGNPFPKHGAFCLETQHYPDSPNHPEFPSTVLKPGEQFQSVTEFRFATK